MHERFTFHFSDYVCTRHVKLHRYAQIPLMPNEKADSLL